MFRDKQLKSHPVFFFFDLLTPLSPSPTPNLNPPAIIIRTKMTKGVFRNRVKKQLQSNLLTR